MLGGEQVANAATVASARLLIITVWRVSSSGSSWRPWTASQTYFIVQGSGRNSDFGFAGEELLQLLNTIHWRGLQGWNFCSTIKVWFHTMLQQ